MVKLSESAGGGDGVYPYWIKRNGKLIKDKDLGPDDLVKLTEGGAYRDLELYAIGADTYQTQGQYPGERRGLVLRQMDDQFDQHGELFRTSVRYAETAKGMGPKTMIGQIFTSIRDGVFPDDEEVDDDFWLSMLGGHFQAMIEVSDDGQYMNLVNDTIKPVRKAKKTTTKSTNELIDEDEAA